MIRSPTPSDDDMTNSDPGLFATMYSARALRRLKPDPIPDDVLFQVLDAAIQAPSGQNVQDWRFLVITDPSVKAEMQEWALEAWAKYSSRFADDPAKIDLLPRGQRLSLRSVDHLAHHLGEVPAIVAIMGLKGRHSTPGGSTMPAVQNLLLAARALGLGASIFNFALRRDRLHELLEIPENNEIICLVPMGYSNDRHGPLKRKPVKDVVYMGKYGQRWPYAESQPDTGLQSKWLREVPRPRGSGG